jgi:hypothetical protein
MNSTGRQGVVRPRVKGNLHIRGPVRPVGEFKTMEKVLFALTFIALFTSLAFESCIEDKPIEAAE